MLGNLYDRALDGERCWVRHDDGRVRQLSVRSWLGGHHADRRFDNAVLELCAGPTIDLGCGPGRLVNRHIERGVPALGGDQSATAVGLARRSGAPALHRDVFEPLPGTGRWQTVLLADGNVGLGGDPWRVLRRASELLRRGGQCGRIRLGQCGSQHRMGPAGVLPRDRSMVPVGIGRYRLCSQTSRRRRNGADRNLPDREPGCR